MFSIVKFSISTMLKILLSLLCIAILFVSATYITTIHFVIVTVIPFDITINIVICFTTAIPIAN